MYNVPLCAIERKNIIAVSFIVINLSFAVRHGSDGNILFDTVKSKICLVLLSTSVHLSYSFLVFAEGEVISI
jgi:hypothetical protein